MQNDPRTFYRSMSPIVELNHPSFSTSQCFCFGKIVLAIVMLLKPMTHAIFTMSSLMNVQLILVGDRNRGTKNTIKYQFFS
jgi:hypothetical protein